MRLHWGNKISNSLVGLEMSPDSLKLVVIDTSSTPYTIENFSISPITADPNNKDEAKNLAETGQILKDSLKEGNIVSKKVAFAIPRSSAIIKTILVDARLTAEELEGRAWIEANRLFPELVGNIYLDFTLAGRAVQDTSQNELILVACRKDQINPYLEMLTQLSLIPTIVDINCYALARALEASIVSTEVMGLLNLNHNLSSFIVVQNKSLLYAHDQTYDGRNLSEQISKYLLTKGLHPADKGISESLKEDNGYIDLLKENLSAHMRHTIHFFYSSRPNIHIQQLVISGDCATLPNLADFIQQEINIPTLLANPFAEMMVSTDIDVSQLNMKSPALMQCCGLALSSFI